MGTVFHLYVTCHICPFLPGLVLIIIFKQKRINRTYTKVLDVRPKSVIFEGLSWTSKKVSNHLNITFQRIPYISSSYQSKCNVKQNEAAELAYQARTRQSDDELDVKRSLVIQNMKLTCSIRQKRIELRHHKRFRLIKIQKSNVMGHGAISTALRI